ncbi:MAG: 4-aminobutyrate--2-oxoglutarate transaminase [Planctomycetes bacterium]|nr:4-aminobutyrate--2-oxoglutarate transaminase [Planctomycetota bacterium]
MATNNELLKRRAAAVPQGPFNVAPIFAARAEGAKLWDVEGNEYIDFCGGIGCVNTGHNHPKVVQAVRDQSDSFIHTCWHVAMYEPYVRLAERLNELTPTGSPNKTALFNSGAEAGENAIKTARKFTKRQGVVAFERGFHGRTLLGLTLTGKVNPYAAGFGPFAPEVYRLPYQPFFDPVGDAASEARAALSHLFQYHIEPENIACVIMEPVLGEGGFFPADPEALKVLRAACTEHGIVFIADEVQTGFGRCGSMFAMERYGLRPDMVCYAKSLAGGMPLSAVTGRAEIMDAPQIGGLGGTFGGNPLACAAANAVLDIMAEEQLPQRARNIGERLMQSFKALEANHRHVVKARGLGAMCAFELVDPSTGQPDKARAGKVVEHSRENGLLVMAASGNVIRSLMPLVIGDEDLDKGIRILEQSVSSVG